MSRLPGWRSDVERRRRLPPLDLKVVLTLINPALVPQTEIQQGPQVKPPILFLAAMFIKKPLHKVVVQQIAPAHCGVHYMRLKPLTQTVSEPFADGRTEPPLAVVEQISR